MSQKYECEPWCQYIESKRAELAISKDTESLFKDIASHLINCFELQYNSGSLKTYKFTEVEIYYFNANMHCDPYVHMHEKQHECGTFYHHGSGMDITFGDCTSYGGILIRGIKDNNTFYDGPLTLIKKIFIQEENVTQRKLDEYLSLIRKEEPSCDTVYHSTRIGLTPHPLDFHYYKNDAYIFKRYRFITDLVPAHQYKEKTKVQYYEYMDDKKAKKPKYQQDCECIIGKSID